MRLGFDDKLAFCLNFLLFIGLTWVLHQRRLFITYSLHNRVLFLVKKLGLGIIFCQLKNLDMLTLISLNSKRKFKLITSLQSGKTCYLLFEINHLLEVKLRIMKLINEKERERERTEQSRAKHPRQKLSKTKYY